MASLKELNLKIASLKNTQKMTKTMKLVAASKLRRAQQAQEHAKDFAIRLQQLLDRLAAIPQESPHPLMVPRLPIKKALVLLVTSDRGLCAGFNNNLIRFGQRWYAEHKATAFETVTLSFCGRRGNTFFRSRVPVDQYYEGVTDRPDYADAMRIGDELMAAYQNGTYDAIYVIYNTYRSPLSQVPTVRRILPIARLAQADAAPVAAPTGGNQGDYIYEPAAGVLLADLLPNAVRFEVFHALLENAAGEHAARMTAMDSATRNAGDMIKFYTLKRNRERQAAITKELIEIVTGAESL